MVASEVFPTSYQEGRHQFLAAAKDIGAEIWSFEHPLSSESAPIFTDVAVTSRKNSDRTLIIQSGTHGIEGLAGSGIQIGLMRSWDFLKAVDVILIHALNPWGFLHGRRVDEHNVDVNRNFVDHTQCYPENSVYDALSDVIALRSVSAVQAIRTAGRIAASSVRYGFGTVRSAISGGQYKHPEGLFFGGKSESWSNRILRRILEEVVGAPSQVVFIDLHTGLGRPRQCEIILNIAEDHAAFQRARSWWGKCVKSTKAKGSVSGDLRGSIKVALPDLMTKSEVTAVTLELGTIGTLKVFKAMQLENWLYHYGNGRCGGDVSESIRTRFSEAFFPVSESWKVWAFASARSVIFQVAGGLF